MSPALDSRRRRRWLRLLWVLPALPFLLEGVYWVAANRYLASERFAARLNATHRKVRVSFEKIYTPFPGRWRAEGIEIRGRTRVVDWWLRADSASGWLDLAPLRQRRISLSAGETSGVTFYLRRREHPVSSPELEAALPVLPATDIESPNPAAVTTTRPRWSFELGNWRFDDVRELWIEQFRLSGRLSAAGGFEVHPGETMEVKPSRLEIAGGEIRIGPRPAARGLEGEVALAMTPFRYQEEKRWDLVPYLRGKLAVTGSLADLAFLDVWLGKLEWLDVRGGEGPFRLDLRLRDSQVEPGSAFELTERALSVNLLGYEARGTGAVQWLVEKDAGGARLAVGLPTLSIWRTGEAEPYLEGKGLGVLATTRDRIVDGSIALDSIEVLLEEGTVRDLRAYNTYLPAKAGVAIRGGSATLHAHLKSPDLRGGTAEIDLSAPRARVDLGGLDLTGSLSVLGHLATDDLASRRFKLDGSRLELTRADVEGGNEPRTDWWGKIEVGEGWTSPQRSPYLGASVRASMRDSGPLIDFLTTRKKLPGFLSGALMVEAVRGRAALTLSRKSLAVDGLSVRGGKLGLDANLRLALGNKSGQVLAQFGRLAVGLELAAGERDWVLLHPRRWWEERTGKAATETTE